MKIIIGLRQPWEWVRPPDDPALVARLREARDYAVPARERETLCGMAAIRIDALRAENVRLREALRHYINVVESVNDPTTFNPRIVLVGHYARAALAKDKS